MFHGARQGSCSSSYLPGKSSFQPAAAAAAAALRSSIPGSLSSRQPGTASTNGDLPATNRAVCLATIPPDEYTFTVETPSERRALLLVFRHILPADPPCLPAAAGGRQARPFYLLTFCSNSAVRMNTNLKQARLDSRACY